jgi:hypothetical protein
VPAVSAGFEDVQNVVDRSGCDQLSSRMREVEPSHPLPKTIGYFADRLAGR